MTGALVGAGFGLLLGLIGHRILSRLAVGAADQAAGELLRRLAWIDLVAMPIVGAVLGFSVLGARV